MREPDDAQAASTEDDASASVVAEKRPAPTKKKRKRNVEAEPPLDDARVREIEACFVAGDFARARALAAELASSDDPRLVDVGRDYLARTGVDPMQLAFLGLCAAALITIAWIYIPH